MTHRWPLHPAATPGEALSSWLIRIAARYGISIEVLTLDIGYSLDREMDLDLAPPAGFVERLATRTGVHADTIRAMSLDGFVPWLLDGLEPDPEAFTTYTRQLSILLPDGQRANREVGPWRPWIPAKPHPQQRTCPTCMVESSPPYLYQLMWSLPLMLTCPVHRCLLETHEGTRWYHFKWQNQSLAPRPANPAIRAMDARTWQALTAGHVDLPRRRVHAGMWFRLLRTLLDELGATLTESGAAHRLTRQVWDRIGQPVRGGQVSWYPYEKLSLAVQQRMLEAAATAIQMLEHEMLTGRGNQAPLFLPEPDRSVDPGRPPQIAAAPNPWKKLDDMLKESIDEAKHDADAAQQLFNILTMYRRDDETVVHSVRTDLEKLGIPAEFLSH